MFDHGVEVPGLVVGGVWVALGLVRTSPAEEVEDDDPAARKVGNQPVVQVQIVREAVHQHHSRLLTFVLPRVDEVFPPRYEMFPVAHDNSFPHLVYIHVYDKTNQRSCTSATVSCRSSSITFHLCWLNPSTTADWAWSQSGSASASVRRPAPVISTTRVLRSLPGEISTSPLPSSTLRSRVSVVRSMTICSANCVIVGEPIKDAVTMSVYCVARMPLGRRAES